MHRGLFLGNLESSQNKRHELCGAEQNREILTRGESFACRRLLQVAVVVPKGTRQRVESELWWNDYSAERWEGKDRGPGTVNLRAFFAR